MSLLANKTILVTGGTGYLGAAVCRKAHAEGAKVLFSYFKGEDKAQALEAELPGSFGFPMDIRSGAEVHAAISKVYKAHETIDVLVNNAASSQALPLPLLEEEDIDLAVNVNLKGPLLVTQAVVKGMVRARRGSIVNVGSIAGHRVLDVPVTYAMTKAAISGMTVALSAEFRRFGIRVNSVVPGMLEGGVAQGIPDGHRQDFLKHCLAGRPGSAEEIANVIVFLASDQASYINAQDIHVNGGI